jgi:hypothetical protein
MTLGELREAMRNRLDDTVEPVQWSDAELNQAINRAQEDACLRADLLLDTLSLPVTLGVAKIALSERVVRVRRMTGWGGRLLTLASQLVLDRDDPGWESRTGIPRRFVINEKRKELQLDRLPESATTLILTVFRLPVALEDDDAEPEIAAHYHIDLLHWAMHLAYERRDSLAQETYDPGRAAEEAVAFERIFGTRRDAQAQLARLREPVRRARGQYL